MKIPSLYNAKAIFAVAIPSKVSFSSKKYPNMVPLEKDTVSFSSKVKNSNFKLTDLLNRKNNQL